MAKQAKTLTKSELTQVLNYIRTQRHAARNRCMVLFTYYAGLRVGEVAALRVGDVLGDDGEVRRELRLSAQDTKGNTARTVFLNDKLRREVQAYLQVCSERDPRRKLFSTQKQSERGFTANTLAQLFHQIYRATGIAGASSHSGRRTFITTLADKGVSVRVLMSLAGHRSISTTQAYIDVNDQTLRKAVELAGSI